MTLPSRIVSAVNGSRRLLGATMLRAGEGAVGVLVMPGAPMPEGVKLSPSTGGHVGAVTPERARELVTLGSPDAAARLDQVPPVGNRWCLVLDGRACALVPFTLPSRPSTPPVAGAA